MSSTDPRYEEGAFCAMEFGKFIMGAKPVLQEIQRQVCPEVTEPTLLALFIGFSICGNLASINQNFCDAVSDDEELEWPEEPEKVS